MTAHAHGSDTIQGENRELRRWLGIPRPLNGNGVEENNALGRMLAPILARRAARIRLENARAVVAVWALHPGATPCVHTSCEMPAAPTYGHKGRCATECHGHRARRERGADMDAPMRPRGQT